MKTLAKTLAIVAAVHTALYPCGPFFEKSPMIDTEGNSRSYIERMREPGVVLPTFKSDYLALLYLPLSGVKYDTRALTLAAAHGPQVDEELLWQNARKQFFPEIAAEKIIPYKAANDYRYVTNCYDDALRYARELLTARAQSPYGKFWLKNQDIVFANCSEKKGALTAPADDAPQTVKHDFLYQQSALLFYRAEYDEAFAGFETLARSGSQHRDLARYMMLRTRMRQTGAFSDFLANGNAKPGEIKKLLDTAITEISDLTMKANAQKLRKLFNAKPNEKVYAQNLISELSTTDPVEVAYEFRYLVRKWQNSGADKAAAMSAGNDLIEWIYTFQAQDAAALATAERKYKETKKSHWLIAVLSKLNTSSPQRDFWLSEATRISNESPAFTTLAFYRLMLSFDAKLSATLSQKFEKTGDASSLNALKAINLRYAQNLTEAAPLLERKILSLNGQKLEHDLGFDSDGARFLTEHASLKDYQTLITLPVLSRAGKTEIARTGWVRSVLLNSETDRDAFAEYLSKYDPIFEKTFPKVVSSEELLLRLLRNPGLTPYVTGHHGRGGFIETIDSLRENWWCRLGGSEKENTGWDHYRLYAGLEESLFTQLYPASLDKPFSFVHGQKEFSKLKTAGNAAEFFSRHIFAAAEKNPTAPWLAEALHRLVKVTRYGCDFTGKGEISKKAFRLLHKNFSTSQWAAKTPYWFN